MTDTLNQLLAEIRACRICADLPHGARPVLQAGATARLRIIGQAPGRKVHDTGVPWSDASGDRLRNWLGLTQEQFYDPAKVAIIPIGFCYPGKGASGDKPPRRECAPQWHARLNDQLPNVELTILVGQYAQVRYLGAARKTTIGNTVRAWREYLPSGRIPLPHPSPRNQPWFSKNPWVEAELVPQVQSIVRSFKF